MLSPVVLARLRTWWRVGRAQGRMLPGGWLFPAATTSWPTPGDFINAVTVQYIAGYGDASADVPARIRHWMYMVCTYMYENRTAFDFSGKQIDLPGRCTDSLLDGFRRYAKN